MSAVRRTCAGFIGRLGYERTASLQESVREALGESSGPEMLLLLEHPPVYTLGRNASRTDLVADEALLAARGITVHETNRGGQITYHGPGQLVGYPILDLNPDRRDIGRYIKDLQALLIAVLKGFDVEAQARQQPETGIWVGERKIASFGVHLRRWRTMHGFALNVTTDLSHFQGIVPCGLPGVEMCSIESLTGERPALEEVADVCVGEFGRVFERHIDPLPEELLRQLAAQEAVDQA